MLEKKHMTHKSLLFFKHWDRSFRRLSFLTLPTSGNYFSFFRKTETQGSLDFLTGFPHDSKEPPWMEETSVYCMKPVSTDASWKY